MSEVDKGCELKVLKIIINKHLDETVSDTSEGLQSLEANRDQIVWELATKIYSQSGHKVEFSILRDVINSRITTIQAELETAHRVAEEKVRRIAEKARLRDQVTRPLEELGGGEVKAGVFVKVQTIISEQLSVDASAANLDSQLSNDLGADVFDLVELVMALEEEFDIEISDGEAEDELGIFYGTSYSGGSLWSTSSGSPHSSSGGAGANCIVKNFINLIYKKVSA